MGIITIGREFGSGGRELGKHLADELGYAYYDKEIVAEIAKNSELDENYVEYALDGGMFRNFPIHFGRTFSYSPTLMANETKLISDQNNFLRELAAKGDCVIIGRAADIILREFNAFNIFVYADMPSKLARCKEMGGEHEHLSDRALVKKIKKIDANRKKYHGMISEIPWGDKQGYHLCVNTSGREIKTIAPIVAAYYRLWREEQN